jgi:hypothetical protein
VPHEVSSSPLLVVVVLLLLVAGPVVPPAVSAEGAIAAGTIPWCSNWCRGKRAGGRVCRRRPPGRIVLYGTLGELLGTTL